MGKYIPAYDLAEQILDQLRAAPNREEMDKLWPDIVSQIESKVRERINHPRLNEMVIDFLENDGLMDWDSMQFYFSQRYGMPSLNAERMIITLRHFSEISNFT